MQLLRVGQLIIIVSPGEVSTMSGRRWKEAIARGATSFLDTDPVVVLGGPANTYGHYVVTPEEYLAQRYEGASTLFGQHQLDAYINLTLSNINYLSPNSSDTPEIGPLPPDHREKAYSFISNVKYDRTPMGSSFGKVLYQAEPTYLLGSIVKATFQGANPRNNLRLGGTYAAVEQKIDGSWVKVLDDDDWFLVYTWRRTNWVLGYSEVDITWETAGNARAGTYRIRYYGDSKSARGTITEFEGISDEFNLA